MCIYIYKHICIFIVMYLFLYISILYFDMYWLAFMYQPWPLTALSAIKPEYCKPV